MLFFQHVYVKILVHTYGNSNGYKGVFNNNVYGGIKIRGGAPIFVSLIWGVLFLSRVKQEMTLASY